MHYCENVYCSKTRGYWVDGDDGHEMLDGVESAKYWREDHDPITCALQGGDCVGVCSSIDGHAVRETDYWENMVKSALQQGTLNVEPYWDRRWNENRYCKAALEKFAR